MLENAKNDMSLSPSVVVHVKERLTQLNITPNRFHPVIEKFKILHGLSLDVDFQIVCVENIDSQKDLLLNSKVFKLILFLNNNYYKKIRLIDAANHLEMSELTFSRFIRKSLGKNYIEYLNDFRLNIACSYLLGSSMAIVEICIECGFCNLPNFYRLFKKRKGITPTEFRRRNESSYLIEDKNITSNITHI